MNSLTTETIKLWGIVQGVGFRPFVAKLADRMHMKGTVLYQGNVPADRAFEHYVTVIGMEETGEKVWFRVMSWGREFRIDAEEYLRGVDRSIPLLGRFFSNILYIREI